MDDLLYEIQDQVAYVTLNRPQARNALTEAMYSGLAELCDRAAADDEVRVMVIRGAGEKAFAAGSDISQFREFTSPQSAFDYERRVNKAIDALEFFPKPLIASINGACAGGGVGIACACDMRIGSAGARVGVPIAKTLGNCIGRSTVVRLSSIVGSSKLVELIFTARLISGTEAHAIGLFNEVLGTTEALDARVHELAKHIAQMAPLTLRATKEQVRRLRAAQVSTVNYEDLVSLCFSSSDFARAVESFLAKQPPTWEGR